MIDKDQQNEQLKKRIVAHQSEIDSVQADMKVLTELSDFAKQRGEHYKNLSADLASRHETDPKSLSVEEKRAYVENMHLQVAFSRYSSKFLQMVADCEDDLKRL